MQRSVLAGGFDSSRPIIYVCVIGQDIYGGKTGSSGGNRGVRSPMARLGTHLYKSGKTQSCIHDRFQAKHGRLPTEPIVFIYEQLSPPLDGDVDVMEDALIWGLFQAVPDSLLNDESKIPGARPHLTPAADEAVRRVLEAGMRELRLGPSCHEDELALRAWMLGVQMAVKEGDLSECLRLLGEVASSAATMQEPSESGSGVAGEALARAGRAQIQLQQELAEQVSRGLQATADEEE